MSAVALIVGLGNPGAKYDQTRHNAGFWFLDGLARRFHCTLNPENRFQGEAGRCDIDGADCRLLKPTTFMNRSGQSVAALAGFFKIPPEAILVVHDELDLEPGTVRLKRGGGHGGHNGLRDLISALGSREFLRLRVGIGHPGHRDDVVNYVLNRPSSEDRIAIDAAIESALLEVPKIVSGDLDAAMNALHRPNSGGDTAING
ncbi:peptidyl-tRNA hydrolase [Thiohalobacter thiocyanaticus]|uniref:Peptidyl-tRNA hydrolase n=1 Tax=Thiohalobacter thiocyanaticus TaxID=585455 RepID=A0A1Z4VU97_9GAMM|nr:aminoacyl-tRNA hydrolase [Thiohalobacter thiocyanaticus]BAZ95189.1 peptidyl-tRNA hydrolase [Thiohalobacter thiocyanaticus]